MYVLRISVHLSHCYCNVKHIQCKCIILFDVKLFCTIAESASAYVPGLILQKNKQTM